MSNNTKIAMAAYVCAGLFLISAVAVFTTGNSSGTAAFLLVGWMVLTVVGVRRHSRER